MLKNIAKKDEINKKSIPFRLVKDDFLNRVTSF